MLLDQIEDQLTVFSLICTPTSQPCHDSNGAQFGKTGENQMRRFTYASRRSAMERRRLDWKFRIEAERLMRERGVSTAPAELGA